MNMFIPVKLAPGTLARRRPASASDVATNPADGPLDRAPPRAAIAGWQRPATTGASTALEGRQAERRLVLRRVTVFDPDQLSDIIPGAHAEHRLLEPGAFEAQALHLEAAKFRLDRLRYSTRVALHGDLPANRTFIAFALRQPEDIVAFGVPQQSHAMMHFDPAAGLDVRLPAGGEWILLSIDPHLFQAELLRRSGALVNAQSTEGRLLRIPGPQWRRFVGCLRAVVDDAGRSPGDPWDRAYGAELDEALFGAVMAAYMAARVPQSNDHGALARRRRLVTRTEEYIYAHIDDSIRMKRLCRDVGASARTLEYAFKGVYGIGVMESLRVLRLNEVRKKLLRAGTKEVKVTTAAMDWGFWHLGEFAAGYKRLFGELPSQTLQRRDPRPVPCASRDSAAPRRTAAVPHRGDAVQSAVL
jgi:AraC-like DNA-binding protein